MNRINAVLRKPFCLCVSPGCERAVFETEMRQSATLSANPSTGAVYSGTKFAVIAISEGLRQENDNIRVTVISPGLTKSELDDTISDPALAEGMRVSRKNAIGADAIARAIAFAVEQPADVNVSEIIMQPTASPY